MNDSSLEAIVLANAITTVEIAPSYRYGDVYIDPSAVIAPGVLLQAEPGTRIIIGAQVCIGAEVVIHAVGGSIEIKTGACISVGVLVFGGGIIGKHACLGANTTLLDPQVKDNEIIPPDRLLGDRSRQVDLTTTEVEFETIPDPFDDPILEVESTSTVSEPISETVEVTLTATRSIKSVAGKAQFDRLKQKLFPNGDR
jgi:carbon dioxide concentrating mechanism protein CcmN